MMVEDLLFNPAMAAKVILDIDLPPHQELRLLTMWTHSMTIDDSGFSSGKTHTAAICISLRAVLMTNRISGVLSKTFRQGKFIFHRIKKWSETNKIFRGMIKHYNGKPRIIEGQEVHQIYWRGGSELRVLPPNWIKDAEGLRGERWNDGYCDEWSSFGNEQSITSVIYGRVTNANEHEDCPVRQNHLHLFSTPQYKHHGSYRIVEAIEKDIKDGNKDYARFTSNYRHIPRIRKWRSLVDRKRIRLMQISNPPGVTGSEVDGLWQEDSMSYYSSLYIEEATKNWNPEKHSILTKRLHDADVYLMAFDMARGSQDRRKLKGDDFGFVVMRLPLGNPDGMYPCFAFRKNGVKAPEAAAVIHKYHAAFGFSFLMYDPGGGGVFVYDELTKSIQRINGEPIQVTPLIDIDDNTGVIGDRIVAPLRRGTDIIKLYWGAMASDNVLLNRMHNLLKQSIELQSIPLPPIPPILEKNFITDIEEIREFLHVEKNLSERERCWCELYLMSQQLIKVDVKRDIKSGEEIKDTKGMMQFSSREKKDMAYCLVYVNTLANVYVKMKELGLIRDQSQAETMFASIQPL